MPAPLAAYVPVIAKGLYGFAQSIFGGGARRAAEKDLENQVRNYKVSPGIIDYYNKALARYSTNPYTGQFYTNQSNQINRNLATGINAAQDRRSGLSAISTLTRGANDAASRAAATAEQLQGQQLGQLGAAAQAKNAAEQKKFDLKYNLTAQKAGQSATRENQGYQNVYGALSDYAKLKMLNGESGGSTPYGKNNPVNDPFPYGI